MNCCKMQSLMQAFPQGPFVSMLTVLVCLAQIETRVYCPLSQMQTFWYRRLLLKDSSLLKKIEADFQAEGGKVIFSGKQNQVSALVTAVYCMMRLLIVLVCCLTCAETSPQMCGQTLVVWKRISSAALVKRACAKAFLHTSNSSSTFLNG